MDSTTFEISPGSPNTLTVPREMRGYINEQGEGRSFNLESFGMSYETEPHRVVIELLVGKKGAEQLEPFTVSLSLGDLAARQIAQALNGALAGAPKEQE